MSDDGVDSSLLLPSSSSSPPLAVSSSSNSPSNSDMDTQNINGDGNNKTPPLTNGTSTNVSSNSISRLKSFKPSSRASGSTSKEDSLNGAGGGNSEGNGTDAIDSIGNGVSGHSESQVGEGGVSPDAVGASTTLASLESAAAGSASNGLAVNPAVDTNAPDTLSPSNRSSSFSLSHYYQAKLNAYPPAGSSPSPPNNSVSPSNSAATAAAAAAAAGAPNGPHRPIPRGRVGSPSASSPVQSQFPLTRGGAAGTAPNSSTTDMQIGTPLNPMSSKLGYRGTYADSTTDFLRDDNTSGIASASNPSGNNVPFLSPYAMQASMTPSIGYMPGLQQSGGGGGSNFTSPVIGVTTINQQTQGLTNTAEASSNDAAPVSISTDATTTTAGVTYSAPTLAAPTAQRRDGSNFQMFSPTTAPGAALTRPGYPGQQDLLSPSPFSPPQPNSQLPPVPNGNSNDSQWNQMTQQQQLSNLQAQLRQIDTDNNKLMAQYRQQQQAQSSQGFNSTTTFASSPLDPKFYPSTTVSHDNSLQTNSFAPPPTAYSASDAYRYPPSQSPTSGGPAAPGMPINMPFNPSATPAPPATTGANTTTTASGGITSATEAEYAALQRLQQQLTIQLKQQQEQLQQQALQIQYQQQQHTAYMASLQRSQQPPPPQVQTPQSSYMQYGQMPPPPPASANAGYNSHLMSSYTNYSPLANSRNRLYDNSSNALPIQMGQNPMLHSQTPAVGSRPMEMGNSGMAGNTMEQTPMQDYSKLVSPSPSNVDSPGLALPRLPMIGSSPMMEYGTQSTATRFKPSLPSSPFENSRGIGPVGSLNQQTNSNIHMSQPSDHPSQPIRRQVVSAQASLVAAASANHSGAGRAAANGNSPAKEKAAKPAKVKAPPKPKAPTVKLEKPAKERKTSTKKSTSPSGAALPTAAVPASIAASVPQAVAGSPVTSNAKTVKTASKKKTPAAAAAAAAPATPTAAAASSASTKKAAASTKKANAAKPSTPASATASAAASMPLAEPIIINTGLKKTATKFYPCSHPGCTELLKTRFSLKRHMKKHTGEKPHLCPYQECGKSFPEASTLKRHLRIHTGEKPFQCSHPGCGKAFADATNVKRHEMVHTGDKPYRCLVNNCTRCFSRGSSLRQHMISLHHLEPNHPTLLAAVKRGRLLKMKKKRLKASEVLEEEAARNAGVAPILAKHGVTLPGVTAVLKQVAQANAANGKKTTKRPAKQQKTATGKAAAKSKAPSAASKKKSDAKVGQKRKFDGDEDEEDDEEDEEGNGAAFDNTAENGESGEGESEDEDEEDEGEGEDAEMVHADEGEYEAVNGEGESEEESGDEDEDEDED